MVVGLVPTNTTIQEGGCAENATQKTCLPIVIVIIVVQKRAVGFNLEQMAKIYFTCDRCKFDNPDGSSKCNRCGTTLYVGAGLFWSEKIYYTKRWACVRCGVLNMHGNPKCHGCNAQIGTGWFDV